MDDDFDLDTQRDDAASHLWDETPVAPAPIPEYPKTLPQRKRTLRTAQFRSEDWERLGRMICSSRTRLKMTRKSFGYCIGSTGKSVKRIEDGRIFGNPNTAPPGDYNTERYVLRRAAFIEMALEWQAGSVEAILSDPGMIAPADATPKVRSHEDIVRKAESRKVTDVLATPEDAGITKILRVSRETYRNAEENGTLPAGFLIEVTD